MGTAAAYIDKKRDARMGGALKDSFRFNRYSTYRQEKDRESNCNLCPLFLTSTASVFTDAILFGDMFAIANAIYFRSRSNAI